MQVLCRLNEIIHSRAHYIFYAQSRHYLKTTKSESYFFEKGSRCWLFLIVFLTWRIWGRSGHQRNRLIQLTWTGEKRRWWSSSGIWGRASVRAKARSSGIRCSERIQDLTSWLSDWSLLSLTLTAWVLSPGLTWERAELYKLSSEYHLHSSTCLPKSVNKWINK